MLNTGTHWHTLAPDWCSWMTARLSTSDIFRPLLAFLPLLPPRLGTGSEVQQKLVTGSEGLQRSGIGPKAQQRSGNGPEALQRSRIVRLALP